MQPIANPYITFGGTEYDVPGIAPVSINANKASKKSNWPRIIINELATQLVMIIFCISTPLFKTNFAPL
jgi:hypothetical protein